MKMRAFEKLYRAKVERMENAELERKNK